MAEEMEDSPELLEGSGDQEKPEKASNRGESFSEVKRKRKREKEADMETQSESDGSSVKRPVFPPVNVSTTLVS